MLSFAIGIKFYSSVGKLFAGNSALPSGFANVIGFFLLAFFSEIFLHILFKIFQGHVMRSETGDQTYNTSDDKAETYSTLNHVMGIVPSFISAFIFLSFLLTLIISLPLSPFLKHAVSSSSFGKFLVLQTSGLDKVVNDVFGGAVNETLNFLTGEPQSRESVPLHFTTVDVSVDEGGEQQMLAMVNKERTSRGLPPLDLEGNLTNLAIDHAKDMFKRGYFSHYTPEGFSPFDRMGIANISFQAAGENLALAPNTDLAMQGLMKSPGHRANILSPDFGRVGIGVVDGGIYGEMFVQEFTN